MKKNAKTKLIGCLVSALFPLTCHPASGPIDLLADKADAVVVAEVQSGQQLGPSYNFVLMVSRSIKGDLDGGSTVIVSASGVSANLSSNRPLNGQFGLWFLKKAGSQWTFMPVIPGGFTLESSGYVPLSKAVSPGAMGPILGQATISDQMAGEIFVALDGYTEPSQLYYLTLHLFGIQRSTMIPGYYRTLRTRSDPQLKVIGLAGLLTGDDGLSALAETADNLDLVRRSRASSLVKLSITGVRSADPSAIASLGKIASAPEPDLQKCAALALENIPSRNALPVLAQLLNSTDMVARESAMRGMSRFVDNLPIQKNENVLNMKNLIVQGPTPYRTPQTDKYSLSARSLHGANDVEYVQFWKSWWGSMKDQIMSGSH